MPIFEFRCLKCQEIFEVLQVSSTQDEEVCCSKCGSTEFERVMSTTNYTTGGGKGASSGSVQTRDCPSGSCTTWDIPGGG